MRKIRVSKKWSVRPVAIALSAALLPLLAPATVTAADDLTNLSIDQLLDINVVTASKFAQKLSEAPSAVSVVTAEDIERFGYRTLADVLRSVRGVFVSYDRNYSYLGSRGSGRPGDFNSRILILVDGQRLNDAIFQQGSIGTEFPIDLALVDRVEYVPGPGSALYGSSAFFGVLNIITKTGKNFNGAEIGVQAGSQGTKRARASYGKKFDNGADLLLSASGYSRRGSDLYFPEYDSVSSNSGIAAGRDHDRSEQFFGKFSYAGFTLETFLGKRTKGVPTASYGQAFNDSRSRTIDQYMSTTASYETDLSKTLALKSSLNLARYDYRGDYVYRASNATINRDVAKSVVVNADLHFVDTSFREHKLVYGIEVFDGGVRKQTNYDTDPYAIYLMSSMPKKGQAAYFQDDYQITEKLALSTGLRFDHDSEGGNAFNPRLGLIYRATPALTTKFLYGTAFRAANAYERYYVVDLARYKVVPGLRSERLKTYEIVTEYYPSPDRRASLSVFNYQLNNLITLVTDPADGLLYFSNVDKATAKGVELEVEKIWQDESKLKASISLQSARNDVAQKSLTNSPHQLAKLNYSRPVFNNAGRASVEAQYTGKRLNVFDNNVPGFAVVNLNVTSHKLIEHARVGFGIRNLLNKRYVDPAGKEHFDNQTPPRVLQSITQDGRTFYLDMTYSF